MEKKKRILVLSDSHGRDENVERAMKQAGRFDLLVHLGDVGYGYQRLEASTPAAVLMIAGNNDYALDLPASRVFPLGPHRVLAVHGHRQQVHFGTSALERSAIQNNCDIVMFGHTHVPFIRQDENLTLLNPGSISLPRQSGHKKTYILIEMDEEGKMDIQLRELD